MKDRILKRLALITAEEQEILDGSTSVDWSIYKHGSGSAINAKKLLVSGKLITVRPHTRLIHFPEHTHDYVEVVYMCSGQTTYIVNGHAFALKQGELLFLSQSATHELLDHSTVRQTARPLPWWIMPPQVATGRH